MARACSVQSDPELPTPRSVPAEAGCHFPKRNSRPLDGDLEQQLSMGQWAHGLRRVQHGTSRQDSLGLWVVLCPDGLELIQVVRAQDGPVTCEVVEVVHDDSHKEVDDL